MIELVIIGAGGVGRAAAEIARAVNAVRPTWRLLGFLDENPARHGEHAYGLPILGGLHWLADRPDVAAHLAIGLPRSRRLVASRLARQGSRTFATLVHPRVVVPDSARVGPGSLLYPGVVVDVDVCIGAHVIVNINCAVCHDDWLGDFATLAPGVSLGGAVRLGEGVDMGIGSCTVQEISVGEWSVVGAGATVIADLPPNVTAVGVPARVIRSREPGWHEG